jgi:prepilin-type N-terminal cleavage/methylation domain-containing protein
VSTPRDAGMTLIETVVTLAVASVLMTIGLFAVRNFLMANRELGTAQQIRSALRNAEEQALSQGRTYCVYFTASTWTTYKSDCTVAANRTNGPQQVADTSIQLAVSFPAPSPAILGQGTACPAAGKCAYFYPRGTALAGSLQVTRLTKTYTLTIEGLTGRVSVA